ncbi:MAG: hypothetical protein V2J26_01410 [Pacificimonas sp.]|nr:hypothetical protein [Pacificimonas sp.]
MSCIDAAAPVSDSAEKVFDGHRAHGPVQNFTGVRIEEVLDISELILGGQRLQLRS